MKWGKRLRTARRRAHLSQRDLAALAGVPQSTVGRIEAGLVEPRIETMDRLLRRCGDMLDVVPRLGVGEDVTLIRERLSRNIDDRVADIVAFAEMIAGARPVQTGKP